MSPLKLNCPMVNNSSSNNKQENFRLSILFLDKGKFQILNIYKRMSITTKKQIKPQSQITHESLDSMPHIEKLETRRKKAKD